MATAFADLAILLKGIPEGAWVAISEQQHEVMAYDPDAQAVVNEAKEQGEGCPLLVRVLNQATQLFFAEAADPIAVNSISC